MSTTDSITADRHHAAALRIIAAGRAPSANALVDAVGGSKTEAVEKLREFWASALPAMLQGHASPLPDPVYQLAAQLWEASRTAARAEAIADHEAQREALKREQASLQQHKSDLARQDVARQARLDAALERVSDATKTIDGQKARISQLETKLDAARDAQAHLTDAMAKKDVEIASITLQRDAARNSLSILQPELARVRSDHAALSARSESLANSIATAVRERDVALLERTAADTARAAEKRLRETAEARLADARGAFLAEHEADRKALLEAHQAYVDRLMLDLDAARVEIKRLGKAKAPIAPRRKT